MHVSKDSKSEPWPCQHRRTDHKQLAATQDPLRYTFINIIHGLVEVGQMRGVSTEVLKQLLHTLGVKGKGPAKIFQRIHLCLCCSSLWPRLPNLGCQHIRCSAAPSRLQQRNGGWPSFPFLEGMIKQQWKIRKQKRSWKLPNTEPSGKKMSSRFTNWIISSFQHFLTTLLEKIAWQSRRAKA